MVRRYRYMGIHSNSPLLESKTQSGRKALTGLLGLTGLALTGLIIWRLGPDRIWAKIAAGSWSAFGCVLLIYILQQALGTLALWLLGTRDTRSGWQATGFWRLAHIRYVGEVLNYAMPTGAVGGEPYKHLILSRAEGKRSSFHALAAAKFLHLAGIGPFAASVFFIAAASELGGKALQIPLFSLAALSLILTVMAWNLVLGRRIGGCLLGGFYRLRRRIPSSLRKLRQVLHIDHAASIQIKHSKGRATLAYVCYIGMWYMASLEWLAIAEVLGYDWQQLGLAGAGMFECTSLLVAAMIPVPAGVGTQEAGKVAVASIVGLGPQMALAMSLIRRAREILMVLVGAILGILEWRRGP